MSWLVLQASLSIVEGLPIWGAYPATPAEALYLALEDGERRLRRHIETLVGSGRPHGFHLATAAPTLGNGLIDALDRWLDRHPTVRLVVVDTLTRVRDRTAPGRGTAYEIDYDAVAPFTELGQRRHIAVVVVHHTRKPKDQDEEDPFDQISGTTGLSGAADMMMMLKRPSMSAEAKLLTRSRDTEDQALTLVWQADRCLWQVHRGHGLPPEQQRLVDLLTREGRPLSPLELTALTGKGYEAIRQLLSRMKQAGILRCDRGRYTPLVTVSQPSATSDDESA